MFELPDNTPTNIKALPRDPRGYPIPYFVATLPDGTRDLRFASEERQVACINHRLCWVCGKRLNVQMVLLGGPLSIGNKKHSDFACHPSCAEFSVKHCPHLNNAKAKYRDNDRPKAIAPDGVIKEHPGVIGLTYCMAVVVYRIGNCLFQSPEKITAIDWYFEGEKISAERASELYSPPADMPASVIHDVREFIKTTGQAFKVVSQ